MNQQACDEAYKNDYTTIIIEDFTGNDLHNFQIDIKQVITLHQEPNEEIEFYFNTLPSNSYSLSLEFSNDLLEYQTYDQEYEITAKALINTNKKFEHVKLFSHRIFRKYKTVYIPSQKFDLSSGNFKLLHVCFHIKRCEAIRVRTLSIGNSLQDIVFETMYKTGLYSDVTLVVKEKSFHVHKLILSIESQEFKRILSTMSGRFLEIDNFEPEVIEALLCFMYTKELKDYEMSVKLIEAACKFNIDDLRDLCENIMINKLCIGNVVIYLFVAETYELMNLEGTALALIVDKIEGMKNINTISGNIVYEKLIKDNIKSILQFSSDNHLERVKLRAFKFVEENKLVDE